MNKRISISLLLFVTTLAASAQNNKNVNNDVAEANLRGKVKSLTETKYITDHSSTVPIKDAFVSTTISKFNDQGNLTEVFDSTVGYLENKSKIIHHYDASGSKTGWTSYDYITGNEESSTISYDENKNKKEIVFKDKNGKLIRTQKFTYDSKRRKISYSAFSVHNIIGTTEEFGYDSLGNLVFSKTTHPDMIEQFKNNEKGDEIECQLKSEFIEFKRTTTYEYETKGNWKRKIIYESDKKHPKPSPILIHERTIEYY